MLGVFAWLMPLSVAISTFGSANGTIFAAGRLCYVASREGHLCDILSFVHKDNLTPAPALLFNAVIAFVMILGKIYSCYVQLFNLQLFYSRPVSS